MRKRRKKSAARGGHRSAGAFEAEIALWILRTLSRVPSSSLGAARSGYDLELLAGLGVDLPAPASGETPNRPALRAAIRLAENRAARARPEPCLASENARLVGRMLGLSKVETALLALTVAFDAEEALATSFSLLRARNLSQAARHLAGVLKLPTDDVQHALRRDGKLRDLGLVQLTRIDTQEAGPVTLGVPIYTVLLRPLQNEEDVLASFLEPAVAPSLTKADFPHLATDLEILERLLRAALAERASGVNVLLHGPPGTGKTELARVVTSAIGARLDEVKLVDGDDDVRDGSARLESYALCQRLLQGRRNTALLFDEVEDAFPCGSWLEPRKSGRNKAWTNRLLERNPIPTVWVSNAIDQIDRAFLRRFDFVLEVAEPPRSVRQRVLETHLRGLQIEDATLANLAEREELSPGHVQRASKVLHLLERTGRVDLESALVRVIDSNLRAYAGPPKRARQPNPLRYDPELLRTDVDLPNLVAGLTRSPCATLCFYGPPGTGKTQLAHHLARRLDRPLLDYRASDLISKWVGDTERAIAAMFERAARDAALLLLDEADGLIAERGRARNTWEITQVNELLTQMEHFAGVFICSTNLLDHVDRAALRRFSIKVRFDYLLADQAERLLRELLERWCTAGASDVREAVEQVRRLRNLTPGDFAAVARRLKVIGPQARAVDVARTLREEVAWKRDRGGRVVGFGT